MRKALFVLVIVVVLTWIGTLVSCKGPIEEDLSKRVTSTLQQSGHDWARVALVGRDLTLLGAAPDEAAQDAAAEVALNVYGVRIVDRQTTLEPPVSPFDWSARMREDGSVVLSGVVPDDETKRVLVARAKEVFGSKVEDKTTIARGAPAGDWVGTAELALANLGKLTTGEASLSDAKLAITGMARDAAIVEDIQAALSSGLSDPFKATAEIAAPKKMKVLPVARPFAWSARKEQGGAVSLSGVVPSEQAKGELIALAMQTFGGRVDDQTRVAAGVPAGDWGGTAKFSLELLQELQHGEVTLTDNALSISGVAADKGSLASLQAALKDRLPKAFRSASTVAVPEPRVSEPIVAQVGECQDLFNQLMQGDQIRFDVNSAAIRGESDTLLGELATTALRCPGMRIEVAGHTDITGDQQHNYDLSQARADAVVDHLVGVGVSRDRLVSSGYGPSLPIASNATEEGRAKNRRIEFVVTE